MGRKKTPLDLITDWREFNRVVIEVTKAKRSFACSDCSFSGIGVISGHIESHCIDHAKDGRCRFYNANKEDVDKIIESKG